jgi:hypothetical protein
MMSKMQIDKQPKTNNPDGRPVGEHGKSSSRTLRIPDNLWERIEGNRSRFIIEAIAEKLCRIEGEK